MPARNLITDVEGLRVGHAHDGRLRSGVTVILPDQPAVTAVDVRGGGPGARETNALDAAGTISEIHGLVLSGGSAFGLDAATGVQSFLRNREVGLHFGDVTVPIVPQAILFDLLNGGNKDWGKRPPYQDLGYQACEAASSEFQLGSVGAGYGATTERLKGGLGSASWRGDGATVGALAAVNAAGNVVIGETQHFLAAPLEVGAEFGGRGWPKVWPEDANEPRLKGSPNQNTTLCVVATDAKLDRPALQRLAIMAQAGLARAIYPVFSPLDGDIVFAISTGKGEAPDPIWGLARLGVAAANTLARAIARGVYEATAFPDDPNSFPAYRDVFPQTKA